MTYGIRVLDKIDRWVSVHLLDVLPEIENGERFHWSILDLYAMGDLGTGRSIPDFEEEVIESERGISIEWQELVFLAKHIEQIYDIVLLGCLNPDQIKRYQTDEEMYEACDIVIVMFDSSYWELFTKDKNLIEKWIKKFRNVEWLIKND